MIQPDRLPGIYELESIVTDREGEPVEEKAVIGMFTFTRDQRLTVLNCSSLSLMAYTGTYRVEGDLLKIDLAACSLQELSGITFERRILELNDERLVLDAVGLKSKLHSVITWKRIANLA